MFKKILFIFVSLLYSSLFAGKSDIDQNELCINALEIYIKDQAILDKFKLGLNESIMLNYSDHSIDDILFEKKRKYDGKLSGSLKLTVTIKDPKEQETKQVILSGEMNTSCKKIGTESNESSTTIINLTCIYSFEHFTQSGRIKRYKIPFTRKEHFPQDFLQQIPIQSIKFKVTKEQEVPLVD